MQRSFEPMRRQVEDWRASKLSDEAAKLIVYRVFIEGELEVPKHLARVVHNWDFDPQYKEFAFSSHELLLLTRPDDRLPRHSPILNTGIL